MRPVADERTAVAAAVATLLAAATISPLIAGYTWLVVAGVVVVTVMVSGIIARHLLGHWVLVALAQLVVMLVALEVLFARSRLLEGLGGITALTDLLRVGLEITRDQPAPVESSQGVMLLAAGGTGVVALLVDVLSASLRQPALSGLPLLAMYCVPAALLEDGLPWYYFAAAALGFLLLLSADAGERTHAWGRVLSSTRRTEGAGSMLSGLGTGGRRVGAVAVVAAVLLPALMPGLSNQMIGGSGQGDGDGNGRSGAITRINPILDLRKNLDASSDTPVIRYSTSVAEPQPLRIVTADVFDGERWSPNTARIPLNHRVQDGLPAAPGLTGEIAASQATTEISISGLAQTYLPLPYPATDVQVNGDWLYDAQTLNVIGRGVDTRNQRYTVQHLEVDPTAEQLAAAGAPAANLNQVYLRLPERLPRVIRTTAQSVAKNGTAYQQAIRLQRWFRDGGGFTYSTQAPGSGTDDSSTDALVQFLDAKRGYCVHFSSAMAVMARTLGIPARVAIGFLPGELQSDGDRVISVHDAHAWPELYFEGTGWVRFEPTPRAGLATPPEWAVAPTGALPEDPLPSEQAQPEPSETAGAQPSAPALPQEEIPSSSTEDGGLNIPWRLVLALAVLAGVLITPWLTVLLASRRRWRSARSPAERAEAAWEELRVGLQDLGVTWARTWTPRAVQQRLGAEYDLGEAGGAALARLVTAIETARYAPPQAGAVDLDAAAASDLRAEVTAVLARVGAAVSRGRRLRARWAPPSAGAVLLAMLTATLEWRPFGGRPFGGRPWARGADAGVNGGATDVPGPEPQPDRTLLPSSQGSRSGERLP
jgi:transglutaminase-like putative cysteine protease